METPFVNKALLFTLSLTWLCVRLFVIVFTPFFFNDDCEGGLPMFLRLVFYTTLISVFTQLVFYTYNLLTLRTAKTSAAKMRLFGVQIAFYLLDYLGYGLCRFAIFIAGAVWLSETDDCDSSTWNYSLALIVGYFFVFWIGCWSVITIGVMTWWDAYTL